MTEAPFRALEIKSIQSSTQSSIQASIQSSELPDLLKHRPQLGISKRTVPKKEARDFAIERFLARVLDRVAFLSDG